MEDCLEYHIEFPMESLGEPPGGFRLVRDEAGLARVSATMRLCEGAATAGEVLILAAEVIPPENLSTATASNLILLQFWTSSTQLGNALSAWNVTLDRNEAITAQEKETGPVRSAKLTSESDLFATIDGISSEQFGYNEVRLFAFNKTQATLAAVLEIQRQALSGPSGPATFSLIADPPAAGSFDFPIHRSGTGWIGSESSAIEYRTVPGLIPGS